MMNLDKEGLAAALVAVPYRAVGGRLTVRQLLHSGSLDEQFIAASITAYLSALPNTGDELVARLRAGGDEPMPMDWSGRIKWLEANWALRLEAANAIASLTARAQAAEASLASAREDALEEAAVAADATEDVVFAVEAIRALKETR